MKFTERELSTMLHALRIIQCEGRLEGCAAGMCEHFDEDTPLTNAEIDELCEKINVDETQDAIYADAIARFTGKDAESIYADLTAQHKFLENILDTWGEAFDDPDEDIAGSDAVQSLGDIVRAAQDILQRPGFTGELKIDDHVCDDDCRSYGCKEGR